ncbi:MAG: hypothetical protein ACFFD1_08885, partial [Candidatus Thorarchaeota archaeon]
FGIFIPLGIGFLLIIFRYVHEKTLTITGLIITLFGIFFIIISISLASGLTTSFKIQFHYQNLKLVIIKTQMRIFKREYTRSYSGMILERINPPISFFFWKNFFPVNNNLIFFIKGEIMRGSIDIDINNLEFLIQKILLQSKTLPKRYEEKII